MCTYVCFPSIQKKKKKYYWWYCHANVMLAILIIWLALGPRYLLTSRFESSLYVLTPTINILNLTTSLYWHLCGQIKVLFVMFLQEVLPYYTYWVIGFQASIYCEILHNNQKVTSITHIRNTLLIYLNLYSTYNVNY